MQNNKTETLNLRLAPRTKAVLREASAHANRSMGNLLEVLNIRILRDARPFFFSSG